MIPKNYDEIEFIDDLTNPIYSIMQETQHNVLAVMTNRIRKIGKLSPTDAQRLSQLVRMEDLKTIESIIAAGTNLSTKQVDSIIEQAATNNDNLADNLYKARNMPPSNFATDLALLNVVKQAKKSMVDNVVNLSKTTGFVFNGKMTDTAKVYNYAVNKAIFEVQQGYFDYNTVMRSTITQLASSGLRTVDYSSGYSRRLDSSVRQNLSDGIRNLNMAYRETQGSQFGSDGVEISAHGLCAPDHISIQGKQYTKKEFEKLNGSLERPIGTMNCHHYIFPIIMDISKPAYSDDELKSYKESSSKEVEYSALKKDKDGKPIVNKLNRYDASQVQRKTETNIRQLKDIRNQLSLNDDKIGVAEYERKIKQKTAYYKKISGEIGLKPQMDRLRVFDGKSSTIPTVKPIKPTTATKVSSSEIDKMSRSKLVENSRKVFLKENSNLGEKEAEKRFNSLIESNTNTNLVKYLKKRKDKL